ncbi:MAG: efflux RND transporter periplasmic adaptor subunit [Acidobacteria bacterium]|nr:efflux RND transporter periplasmic adaptor subunit [Acidobacteriota bacterium]
MKRSHRLKKIVPVLGIAFLLNCGKHAEEEQKADPVVAVKVATAEEQDIRLTVHAPATVFPREQANVASRITAPIIALGAKKGDRVAAGQVLARLDNRDLLAQRRELAAAVGDAEASMEKTRLGTVPADLERARGQVATTQAALNQAEKFLERRKQLFEQGAIPNRDLLISQTELATARANFDVAQRNLSLLEKQSTGRDIEIAQSRLEQAKGRLAGVDAQIAFSELKSPFGGFITEQFVFPGDMAQPSTPMFTVADLDVAVARAQVPEADAGGVRRGALCELRPSDQNKIFSGRVSVVNQAVDPARRTVEVWCEIPNPKGELRAQVFGSVEISTGRLAKAVTVPVAAVQFDEGARSGFVMTVGEEKKAKKKQVETGTPVNGRAAVLKGLDAGEMVIVEGAYGLAEGTKVTSAGDGKK